MYLPQNDWNRGTYRELKAILNELPERYLDQTATILLEDSDEYVTMGSIGWTGPCLLYTSPSPRDLSTSRMPSSA